MVVKPSTHSLHFHRTAEDSLTELIPPNIISPIRYGCGKEKSAFEDFKRQHCGPTSLINGHEGPLPGSKAARS